MMVENECSFIICRVCQSPSAMDVLYFILKLPHLPITASTLSWHPRTVTGNTPRGVPTETSERSLLTLLGLYKVPHVAQNNDKVGLDKLFRIRLDET